MTLNILLLNYVGRVELDFNLLWHMFFYVSLYYFLCNVSESTLCAIFIINININTYYDNIGQKSAHSRYSTADRHRFVISNY